MKVLTAKLSDGTEAGAIFSDDRIHRYALWRDWDIQNVFNPDCMPSKSVMFIGLNPSTATEKEDDPTIRRCIGFAKDWGFGKMFMMNIFALRSTDPNGLKTAPDPLGPENNNFLMKHGKKADLIIAAWGTFPEAKERGKEVAKMFEGRLHCLKKTKQGYPSHPLYLRKDLEPIPYP